MILEVILFIISAIGFVPATMPTVDLSVRITHVEVAEGELIVALFNEEESFLKKPLRFVKETAIESATTVKFSDIPEGIYAVSIIHDKNKNGKLDTNTFGLPTESYGFSNNATGMFGPPSFKKASFDLREDMKIQIDLH